MVQKAVHLRYSLGYWQNGSWARVRKQGVAHCRPMDLRTWRKMKLLFLEKVAEVARTEMEDSPPGPPPGEGAALFSPSPEKEQIPTSPGCPRQGCFVDFLDDLGPGWDAGGATLLREARRSRPRYRFSLGWKQLWRTQEGSPR